MEGGRDGAADVGGVHAGGVASLGQRNRGVLVLLAASSCTLVQGRDMGPKFEHVRVTRDGMPVTNASVSVNGTAAPLGSDSHYHATLPSAVAVGGRLYVRVGSGLFSIHGQGTVPRRRR